MLAASLCCPRKRRERGGFRMRPARDERGGSASAVLKVGNGDDPRPGPGEVLVRLSTSGINPGDTKKRSDWMGFGKGYPRVVPYSVGLDVQRELSGSSLKWPTSTALVS